MNMLFSGTSNKALALKIAKALNMEQHLNSLRIEKFEDNEILPMFTTSIRGEDVFYIQTTDTSNAIMETVLVTDAAKRAGCNSFTIISAFLGYGRQDRNDHTRSSIGSKVLADMFTAVGVSKLITIDMHNGCTQGFYNIPVIHLNGNKIFIDYIKSLNLEDICITSPDQGAVKKNIEFGKALANSTFAMINKRRIKPNEIHSMELIGDVKNKNVIIVDDLGDTMKTVATASKLLIEHGASSCRAIVTHPVFSGQALENIYNSNLTEVIVSDTIGSIYEKLELYNTFPDRLNKPKLSIISSDKLIAKSIDRLIKHESISELNIVE